MLSGPHAMRHVGSGQAIIYPCWEKKYIICPEPFI